MATRWMKALVEPPKAMSARQAFSKAAAVMMSRGSRSSHTMSTMRRPQPPAMRLWPASTAGVVEAPGRVMPRVSASMVMVIPVPMVMQMPGERAMPPSISRHWHSVMVPARSSAQYFQASLPLPRVSPRQLPRSMGPAGRKMAGMFMLAAPISRAGVVLSHPPMRTTPSNG